MMVKSAQPGVGGGTRPPPHHLSLYLSKVVVDAPAETVNTLTLFLLYPHMDSVVLSCFACLGPHILCLASIFILSKGENLLYVLFGFSKDTF